MTTKQVDEAKLEEFMGTLGMFMTGGAMCCGILLGDELGFYAALDGAGPVAVEVFAKQTGCNARLVREWLDSQAAAGLLGYDAEADTYEMSPEASMAFANEEAPTFVARGMNVFASIFADIDKFKAMFQGDGGMSWGDHHHTLFKGTEWFFRPGYRALLPEVWLPAMDGVVEKLNNGAAVADVGCGHGASTIVMAEAFPNGKYAGFDFHGPSIDTAKQRATEHGVADRCNFEAVDSKGYPGTYDLICFFDCLHDMGDPVGIARYAREHLAEDGSVLLVEPFALDGRATNMKDNPFAAMGYLASTIICTPNSLSQEVGLGLGAQAGEAQLRAVFEEAGFTTFCKVSETPNNLIIEAKA